MSEHSAALLITAAGAVWVLYTLMFVMFVHEEDNPNVDKIPISKRPQLRVGERGVTFLVRLGFYFLKAFAMTPVITTWILLEGSKKTIVWLVTPQSAKTDGDPR